MMLDSIAGILKVVLRSGGESFRQIATDQPIPTLKSIGFDDFLAINMPPREMLLNPILPERSLAMLYAPRGVGKTLLSLSIGLAVASGCPLLRWHAPCQRRVLYVDGEMPLVSLQERLRSIATGLGAVIPNDGFRVLAADNTEHGLSIGSADGQRAIDPLVALTSSSSIIFPRSARTEVKVPVMLGCRCKIGCLNCGGRASLFCLFIMQARTVGNAARRGVRTLSIRSLPCADPKITRLNKALDLKCILRNCGIGLTATALFLSRRNLMRL